MDVKDALQLAYKLGQRNTPESHGELMKLVADHRPQHPVRRHEIASEQTDEMMDPIAILRNFRTTRHGLWIGDGFEWSLRVDDLLKAIDALVKERDDLLHDLREYQKAAHRDANQTLLTTNERIALRVLLRYSDDMPNCVEILTPLLG